ncbi:hypothetical protein JTB14_008502 [Gonioctena quinquepunctata]|nr:hypothetical protein JTB14_008502 [Gonioctena quinquepunctata]
MPFREVPKAESIRKSTLFSSDLDSLFGYRGLTNHVDERIFKSWITEIACYRIFLDSEYHPEYNLRKFTPMMNSSTSLNRVPLSGHLVLAVDV